MYNNLDDNISVDNILIFHPSSNYIEIIFKGFILNNYKNSIKIYNPLGDSVLLYEINNSSNIYRIDISNLPTGVYFFNLGNRVEKFFVVR
ncbi:MAG: T9SS type A sorting domain-containing protein [Ignavibacteria bacterium]|nr:T9SS type A sorting domain-containing protein [Ignavibacteria bacterium]